jgi:NAD(P)-dependent dehydrogenase (short-subunit alcohol dehydrogenase family)
MGFTEADIPAQDGRVAVVTGANSGIGFETARALAAKGARVVLACRDEGRGREAESRIRDAVADADVRFEPLDLSSLASVEQFAEKLLAEESRLDILCNNAGVMMPPLGHTADGFEMQLGVNHLGHFALTGRLLGRLQASPGARVVALSSLAHFVGSIDFGNLNAERGYNRTLAYGRSKVANLLFARELQRRFEKAGTAAIAAAAHPGSTRTNLQRHSRSLNTFVAMLSQEPAEGALPTLYAATAPDVRGGDYFGPSGFGGMTGPPAPARSSGHSKDTKAAAKLWDVSEELTGVHYAFSGGDPGL